MIDTAALTSDVDVTALVQGVRLARLIATSALLDPWRGAEVPDSAQRITTPELERFARQSVAPVGHLAGTCRMGPADDPMAVVDSFLRVRGVEGLRVAGAAVMPDIVNAPPRAAAVMIGDRCADVALTSP